MVYAHLFHEENTYSCSMLRSICMIHLCEPHDVYVRLRGCRSHQEEAKKRKGARAMRKRIPRCARGPRRCGTMIVRLANEAKGDEEEARRSLGEREHLSRRSEGIEREAIRECLMSRTKLCNYLYVCLKTISWASAFARCVCVCDTRTCIRTRVKERYTHILHIRARKSVRSRMRVHPMVYHGSHPPSPKAHERHIFMETRIMLLPTIILAAPQSEAKPRRATPRGC